MPIQVTPRCTLYHEQATLIVNINIGEIGAALADLSHETLKMLYRYNHSLCFSFLQSLRVLVVLF